MENNSQRRTFPSLEAILFVALLLSFLAAGIVTLVKKSKQRVTSTPPTTTEAQVTPSSTPAPTDTPASVTTLAPTSLSTPTPTPTTPLLGKPSVGRRGGGDEGGE